METNMTRRDFLKRSVIATAGGAAMLSGMNVAGASGESYATVIDLTKCDGCGKCVTACQTHNGLPVTDEPQPYDNWVHIQKVDVDGEEVNIPRRCMHCDNPPCVNLCPFGVNNKYDDGSVVIDDYYCFGGAKCKSVCPWQIPVRKPGVGIYLKFQPLPVGGGVMQKCTMCHDLIEKGGEPACVTACAKEHGEDKATHFGPKEQMRELAYKRAEEVDGYVYGDKENGGTSTFYVSSVPYESINTEITEMNVGTKKTNAKITKDNAGLAVADKTPLIELEPQMHDANNPLEGVTTAAQAVMIAPVAGAVGAAVAAIKAMKDRED